MLKEHKKLSHLGQDIVATLPGRGWGEELYIRMFSRFAFGHLFTLGLFSCTPAGSILHLNPSRV